MTLITKWMALPILAAGLLLAPTHSAVAQDSTTSPDAKNVAAKTGKDVAKGTKADADKTADGTKVAADKTASGTKTAADKTADGTKAVAKGAAKGTTVAAKDTAKGTKAVAGKTAHGAKKVFSGSSTKVDDSAGSKPPAQ